MASIRRAIVLDAPASEVWDAVADFGELHKRLVPGFVVDTELDGDTRIVTFASGNTVRETLVDCDHQHRRLVYTIANERITHYNASVEILADGDKRCRLIWIVDVLPHDMAPYVGSQMDLGAQAMQAAFRPA
jgi:hypothetical protein